jgi:hypothetical protein
MTNYEPICGFGPDNKHCPALWQEHQSSVDAIAAAKSRVEEAVNTFLRDLVYTAPEMLGERLYQELPGIVLRAFNPPQNLAGTIVEADTVYTDTIAFDRTKTVPQDQLFANPHLGNYKGR